MTGQVSHYRIVALLGRGAMGEVYRAIDERLGRPVALKLLPAPISGSTDLQARLLREAQAASALNHPGIVIVHDVGAWEGRVFMVMELVDGERLSDFARSSPPIPDVLALVADVADALDAAHARSILHRDIKSDNLMRTRDGRVKVLDFGLAKLHDALPEAEELPEIRTGKQPKVDTSDALALTVAPETQQAARDSGPAVAESLESAERSKSYPTPRPNRSSETIAGSVFGTPAYMSPEQASGNPVDACSEVFSLGIVLYELLTGKLPFDGKSLEETLEAIKSAPLPAPSKRAPDRELPPFVDALVMRALDRDRTRRFPDMGTFARALREARARLVAPRRSRLTIGLSIGAVIVTLGGLAAYRATRLNPVVAAARRLTFDPGCEEMPSFSEDGRTLYYDSLIDGDYDVFALDLASGTRTRISKLSGWDWGASQSPDGHAIAWVHGSDRGDELALLDGAEPRFLGPMRGVPGWTRDGAILMSPDGMRVDRVDPKSGAHITLATLGAHAEVHALRAFDDGTPLVAWNGSATDVEIGLIERGAVRAAVTHLPAETVGIASSPDQHGFYFTRHNGNAHELVRRSRRGGDELVVLGVSPTTIAVTRDGKRLAFSTCEERQSIVRVGADGVAHDFIGGGTTRDDHPVPIDGTRVVFSSDRAGPGQLWIFDGSTYRPLTGPDTFYPAVSSDRRQLAWLDGPQGGLFVGDLDGKNARRVTSEGTDLSPAFTRDGGTIVFERGARVWAVPTAGGATRAIAPDGSHSPTASPRDRHALYVQTDGDRNRLMDLDLDSGVALTVGVALPKGKLVGLALSPDGRHAAFLHNSVELLEVELKDGATPATRWKATVEGVQSFAYAPSGELLIALTKWEGDVWLADASLP